LIYAYKVAFNFSYRPEPLIKFEFLINDSAIDVEFYCNILYKLGFVDYR